MLHQGWQEGRLKNGWREEGRKARVEEMTNENGQTERQARRIIVAEEHHGRRYLDASTDEQWAVSALALLTERLKSGNWYIDPFEDTSTIAGRQRAMREPLLTIKEETIANLPLVAQQRLRDDIERARWELKRDEGVREEYQEIRRAVESQDLSWWGKGRMARPLAWSLLESQGRDRGEVGSVELETVEVPEAPVMTVAEATL